MDQRPKRNRDKYNPYILSSDRKKNLYMVSFTTNNKEVHKRISKRLFEELDELEKNEAKRIQWEKRHIEHSNLTEISLFKRACAKQINIEDSVLDKDEKERLYRALDKIEPEYRRIILLYFRYRLSFSQIAEIENCVKSTAKYKLDKALNELRKKFFEKN